MPGTEGRGLEDSVGLGGAKDGRGRRGRSRECCRGRLPWGRRVFVDFAGVERCVMVVADGDGDDVGSRRL